MTEATLNQTPLPECYGIYWEAIPGTPDCVGCSQKDGCLQRFSSETLPAARKVVGDDLPALSKATEVKTEAILIAMNQGQPSAPKRRPTVATGNNGADPAPVTASEDLFAVTTPPPIEPEPQEEPEPEPEGEKQTPPKKKKTPSTKKAGKKKAGKKKAAKKSPPKVSDPPVAGPAKSALGPVPSKTTSARDAMALASPPPKRKRYPKNEREQDKFLRKWLREREKHPRLGVASPGTLLRGTHNGRPWEIKVLRGAYLYEGWKYPTAQSVTNAATGKVKRPRQRLEPGQETSRPKGTRKMSNWSWEKFFNRALKDLERR